MRFHKGTKFIRSRVLDHYEKYKIREVHRYPAYWTSDMIYYDAMHSKWAELGEEMAIVTIGQYRSLLVPMI